MKDVRYVIRLAHTGAYTPSDQAVLLSKAQELIRPLGGRAINLRVTRQALEFDLYFNPDQELHPFLTALEPLGTARTYVQLDLPAAPKSPDAVIAEARKLFNEERYWEAHEVLEGLWKTVKGSEKLLVQGLILTAAALVHAQKDERAVMGGMLEDALERMKDPPDAYYGLDVRRFMTHMKKIILTRASYFPTI